MRTSRPCALADLLDLGRDGVGDPRGLHVEAGVDALDPDAGDARGQRQQLARERAAADDDEPRRDGVGRGRWPQPQAALARRSSMSRRAVSAATPASRQYASAPTAAPNSSFSGAPPTSTM